MTGCEAERALDELWALATSIEDKVKAGAARSIYAAAERGGSCTLVLKGERDAARLLVGAGLGSIEPPAGTPDNRTAKRFVPA